MTHFGILCLAATGHLNTMLPLGHELKKRGHRITILSGIEAQESAETAGFEFCESCSYPIEYMTQSRQKRGNLAKLVQTMKGFVSVTERGFQKIPTIVKTQKIEALLVDLSVFEGGTIADHLNIPYITIACLLPFYRDPTIPPIFTTWQYSSKWWAKPRNQLAYTLGKRLAQPVWQVIHRYRQQWQLPPYTHDNDIFSDLATITRHIRDFEFPRKLPAHFHFTGPFHQAIERQPVAFPFEQLNDKPLVYASMGTLQNLDRTIFHKIASACAKLDVQLVLSLGGGLSPKDLSNLVGNPIVVKYAPQLELLKRASLVITHAGLNTVLEALSYGTPMIAIPITDDQPGIAARVAWTGTGEIITPAQLSVAKLQATLRRVLTEKSYQEKAVDLQTAINHTTGTYHAANIIEQAVLTQKPVESCLASNRKIF